MALKDWEKKQYSEHEINWTKETDKETLRLHLSIKNDMVASEELKELKDTGYALWLTKSFGSAFYERWIYGFQTKSKALRFAKDYMRRN